jgi:hypothetical protein
VEELHGKVGKRGGHQGKGRSALNLNPTDIGRGLLTVVGVTFSQGNAILKTQPARAVAFYTQAICLDSENPVYYLNRAVSNNLQTSPAALTNRADNLSHARPLSTPSRTMRTQRSTALAPLNSTSRISRLGTAVPSPVKASADSTRPNKVGFV